MIEGLIIDLPVLGLFMKFMIASTVLMGSVWLLEKVGVINSPDMSETAWKFAIAASFISLLPVSLTPNSLTIPIEQTFATEYGAVTPGQTNRTPQNERRDSVRDRRPTLQAPPQAEEPRERPVLVAPIQGTVDVPQEQADPVVRDDASATPTLPIGATETEAPSNASPSLDILLIGTWIGLALIALGALVASYFRAVKSLGDRERVPAEHHANRTLRALCEQVDIKHVPYLTRSSAINSPVCLPRREICLPDWAFEDMDEKALDSLIAHELAHMLRRDPVMMIFTQTLCRVFFFQPLFALARRRLEDNAELAADQWAATHLSTAKAVATALYTCTQKITEKRQLQWGLAMAGDKSILKQRVERLLKADGSSFSNAGRLKRGGLAAALLVAVLSVPSIEFATAMTAAHPHEEELEERRAKRERLARENADLHRALAEARSDRDSVHLSERQRRDIERAIEDARRAGEEGARISQEVQEALQEAFRDGDHNFEELSRLGERLGHLGEIIGEETVRAVTEAAEIAAITAEATAEATAAAVEASMEASMHRIEAFDNGRSGNMQWNDDDYSVRLNWDGRFDLSDDEKSIKRITRGGTLNIRTDDKGDRRRIRIESNRGEMETTYWVDGERQTYDADGEKWLADTLALLIRRTPIAIEDRIERYLEQGGTKLALKRFEELESDYVKRVYATVLVDEVDLSERDVKRLFKSFKSVESDYEVRLFLATLASEGLITKDLLDDVLDLSKEIESDYELRLMLTPLMSEFAIDDKNMKQILERAASIESDYELRLLLSALMAEGNLSRKNQKLFIKAAETIESDYELRLALTLFAHQADLDENTTEELFDAIGKIEGDYERRLALSSLIDQGDMNDTNWLKAIKLAEAMDGDYEKRLILSQIRDDMPSDNKLENAYMKAVESIDGEDERAFLTEDR